MFFGLAIPAQNFYDDIKLQALKGLEGGCWDAFNELVELMGWEFDEEKDSFFAEVGPFLGFIKDFSRMLVDQKVSLSTKASFHESLATSLQRARDSGRLYSGDCHSLQGKILHQSNAYVGRVGRGQAFAFGEHAKSPDPTMPLSLVHNVEGCVLVYIQQPLKNLIPPYVKLRG